MEVTDRLRRYEYIKANHEIKYVAGGAAQNAARGAAVSPSRIQTRRSQTPTQRFVQYILPPNSVVYTGCVGDDDLAEELKTANKREGLQDAYLVKKGEKTGACAVVITGHNRYMRCVCTSQLL